MNSYMYLFLVHDLLPTMLRIFERLGTCANHIYSFIPGRNCSPPSAGFHVPDTTSPVYPDRPIRPLPKRRLRDRLSADQAGSSALSPPDPPSSQQPLFYFPQYGDNSEPVIGTKIRGGGGNSISKSIHIIDRDRSYEDEGLESDHEDAGSQVYANHKDTVARSSSSPPPDGYDSFENTNNKKKRKIPTSGSIGGHHSSSLSAELASMGICCTRTADAPESGGIVEGVGGVGQYYGSGNSATRLIAGVSGSGRGRYGRGNSRNLNVKSPLGLSINGMNSLRPARRDWGSNPISSVKGNPLQQSEQGIISTAIANAAALPVTPQGQENVSLLQQQKSTTPTKTTPFTFTCESESAKSMAWPSQSPTPTYHRTHPHPPQQQAPTQKGFSTQGTQTSPNMAAGQAAQQPIPPGQAGPQTPQKKTRRRRPGKELENAERQRRLQQEYNKFHHPPKLEDIWICEYCEYESIFGTRPEALIRQYEIKDRKERKRLEEKRRLLEKAKTKGRKGRRPGKKGSNNPNATSAANAANAPAAQQPGNHQLGGGIHSQGTQSEDYLGDEYDDPGPLPAPPPQAPLQGQMPAHQAHNLRQPPGTMNRVQGTGRGGTAIKA
ncbi:MAG: hypothetical protein M1834_009134 [Cirrosporium novae-zelandiae]|nr:MAG: hypothetical protein M1834_009134 [Cirrosporium novae-zelandiae]